MVYPYSNDPGYFRWLLEASYSEFLSYHPKLVSSERRLFSTLAGVTVPYYERLRQLMADYFSLYHGSSVLDGGCGLGRLSYDAAVLGHSVVGVDLSLPFIRFCKELSESDSPLEVQIPKVGRCFRKAFLTVPDQYRGSQCQFKVEDVLQLPFSDRSFSYILSSNVLDRVKNPYQMVQEIHRVLRSKGRAIVTSPLDWELAFTPKVEWWTESLLEIFPTNEWDILHHDPRLKYCVRISDRYLQHYLCEVIVVEKV